MTGSIILDLNTPEISMEEQEILQHPLVAGVILFSRHYESVKQIKDLCGQLRRVRSKPLLITVDHEGGRVQRFRDGFTLLPPMRFLGSFYEKNPTAALTMAEDCGWLVAAELFSVGVNLTFAPVLDLDRENQTAIGDRAFHSDPEIVIRLTRAFINGLQQVGMSAIGKHFPGHGGVASDTHKTMPIDLRGFKEIMALDGLPFARLIAEGLLEGIMPAHIQFPQVDEHPVVFSSYWLKKILRAKLKFQGTIISDDLNMEGASVIGDYADRAKGAFDAGCNLILICNNRAGAIQILDRLPSNEYHLEEDKMERLLGRDVLASDYRSLLNSRLWKEKNERVMKLRIQEIQYEI